MSSPVDELSGRSSGPREQWLRDEARRLGHDAGVSEPVEVVISARVHGLLTASWSRQGRPQIAFQADLLRWKDSVVQAALAHEVEHLAYYENHLLRAAIRGIEPAISAAVSEESHFLVFHAVSQLSPRLLRSALALQAGRMAAMQFMDHLARREEYRADRDSVALVGRAEPLLELLRSLRSVNFEGLNDPRPFVKIWGALNERRMHPPLARRIAAIEGVAAGVQSRDDTSTSVPVAGRKIRASRAAFGPPVRPRRSVQPTVSRVERA